METPTIRAAVDIGRGAAIQGGELVVQIRVLEVCIIRLFVLGCEDYGFAVRVNRVEQHRHEEELCVVSERCQTSLDSSYVFVQTHVSMNASCGSTSYFCRSKTLIRASLSPFRAEMLSAKRQFMGMLGLEVPSKRTMDAALAMPLGNAEAISGLFGMPTSNSFWVSRGME